jgi:glyoxylase-like metal-dependent hydrolase (beta-lactamase superfamily II)
MSNIREKLMPLPDETVLLSGHGPATTIGEERRTNPFLAE